MYVFVASPSAFVILLSLGARPTLPLSRSRASLTCAIFVWSTVRTGRSLHPARLVTRSRSRSRSSSSLSRVTLPLCLARATESLRISRSLSLSRARGTLSLSRPCGGGDRSHGRSLEWWWKPGGQPSGSERCRREPRVGETPWRSGGERAGGRTEVSGRRSRRKRERERTRRGADDPSSRAMPLNRVPAPFSRQSDAGRAVGTVRFSCSFSPVLPCRGLRTLRVTSHSLAVVRGNGSRARRSRRPRLPSRLANARSAVRLAFGREREAEEGRQMLEPNLQARRLPRGSTLAAATRVQRGFRPADFVTCAR